MLRKVSVTINTECSRQWAVVLAEHRAKAVEIEREIRARWRV